MSRSRTIVIPGAAYHSVAVVHARRPIFTNATFCRIAVDAFAFQRRQGKIEFFAYVVMPDHVHWVLRPTPPNSIAGVVRNWKAFTAKRIVTRLMDWRDSRTLAVFALAAIGRCDQSFRVWQPEPWIQTITDTRAMRAVIEYVHANPVRASLVQLAAEYPWSSAAAYEGREMIGIDSLPE